MNRRLPFWIHPGYLGWLSAAVLVVSLSTGKALLSIATVAFAFAGLWNWLQEGRPSLRRNEQKLAIWLGALFFLALISGFWTDNQARWQQDLYQKLPFLLLPIGVLGLPVLPAAVWRGLRLLFVATQSLIALLTLGQFAMTYRDQLQRVAENAGIDVVGSISHIYFGLMLGWSVCVGLWLWWEVREKWPVGWRIAILIMSLFNLLAIHLLVSRTGLLSCYAGLAALAVVWFWQMGKRWRPWLLVLLALLMLAPVAAFWSVPSFRLRVEVSLWDWQQYQQSEADLSDNSLSLRLLAWQAAWGLVQEHPWLGVGLEDVGAEMLHQYEAQGLNNRAGQLLTNPHNQYLKQWAGAGLPGILVLLLALGQPVWSQRKALTPPVVAFAATMAVALLFESLLERQIGMSFFVLFSLWQLQTGRTDHIFGKDLPDFLQGRRKNQLETKA